MFPFDIPFYQVLIRQNSEFSKFLLQIANFAKIKLFKKFGVFDKFLISINFKFLTN